MTFAVNEATTALRITARWGHYVRTEIDDDKYRSPKTGKLRRVWQREPIEGVSPASLSSAARWPVGSRAPTSPTSTCKG